MNWFLKLFASSSFFLVSSLSPLKADEYIINGTVTSVLYGAQGKPIKSELAPGILPTNTCNFIWYRKNEKWRLDINQPDPAFQGGIWRSIMPFGTNNLISIISYPPRPDNPNSKGNAYVTIMTNIFLPAENIFGAHAIWLTFNLDNILKMIAPSNACPPFWSYDSSINHLLIKSRIIIQTNQSFVFWNPGHHLMRDTNQNVLFVNGQPKFVAYPFPLNNGFAEAEFKPSVEFLDESHRILKFAELTYFAPFKDKSNPDGIRMQITSKLTVNNKSVQFEPVSDSFFSPSWQNAVAVVVDFREKTRDNKVLNYITTAKQISPSKDELLKNKQFANQLLMSGVLAKQSYHHNAPLNSVRIIIIILFLAPIIIIGFVEFKRRRK